MKNLLISYIKPGMMFQTIDNEIVTADEKGTYMSPYENIYMVEDEYGNKYVEEDIEEVFTEGLYTSNQVYEKVQTDYDYDDNSLCSAYFDFQVNNVSKMELLMTYIELQTDINGDYCILIEDAGNGQAKEVADLNCVSDYSNLNIKGIEGKFTGNVKNFLTQLELDNPNLCRFDWYDTDKNNVITEAESVGFFQRDFFNERYDCKNREEEHSYE